MEHGILTDGKLVGLVHDIHTVAGLITYIINDASGIASKLSSRYDII